MIHVNQRIIVIFRKIVILLISLISYRICSAIRFFVSSLYISKINDDFLLASSLINNIQIILFIPSSVLSVLSFNYRNKIFCLTIKNKKEEWFLCGFFLSLAIGIITSLICFSLDTILIYMNFNKSLVSTVYSYFFYYGFSIIPGCIAYGIQNYLIGIGKQKISLFSNMFSTTLMILFLAIYELIAPDTNNEKIIAISFAHLMYQIIVIIFITIFYKENFIKFFTLNNLRIQLIQKQISLGSTVLLLDIHEPLVSFIKTTFSLLSDNFLLISQNIILQYYTLFIPLTIGLSQCTAIITSRLHKKYFKEILCIHIMLLLLMEAVFIILFLVFRNQFFSMYIENAIVTNDIIYLFCIYSIYIFFYGIKSIIFAFLRASGILLIPVILDILINWCVGIFVSYIYMYYYGNNLIVLNIIFLISMIITILFLIQYGKFSNKI